MSTSYHMISSSPSRTRRQHLFSNSQSSGAYSENSRSMSSLPMNVDNASDSDSSEDELDPRRSVLKISVNVSSQHTSAEMGNPKHILIFFQILFFFCFLLFAFPVIIFIKEYALFKNDGEEEDEDSAPMPQWIKVAALVYWLIFTLIFLLVMTTFWKRRRCHPLRARSPWFLGIFSAATYIFCTWVSIGYYLGTIQTEIHGVVETKLCGLAAVMLTVGYPALITPYFFRALRISRVFGISAESVRSLPDLDEPLRPPQAVVQVDATEKYLLRWWFVLMLPFVGIAVSEVIPHVPYYTVLNPHCFQYSALLDYWVVYHICEAGLLLAAVLLLSNVLEEFNIRVEIMIAFVIYLIYAFVIVILLFQLFTLRREYITELLVLSRGAALFTVSVVWPTFRTFFQTPIPEFPHREAVASLQNILKDHIAAKYYHKFMKAIRSSKILEFWTQAELFMKNSEGDYETLRSEAKGVLETYFADPVASSVGTSPNETTSSGLIQKYSSSTGASRDRKSDGTRMSGASGATGDTDTESHTQSKNAIMTVKAKQTRDHNSLAICVSEALRQQMWREYERDFSRYLFQAAQQQCYQYMEDYCYPRFLRSPHCKQFLAEIDKKEEMFGRLIGSSFL